MPGGEIKLLGAVASAGLSLSSPFVFSQCLFKKSVTGGWGGDVCVRLSSPTNASIACPSQGYSSIRCFSVAAGSFVPVPPHLGDRMLQIDSQEVTRSFLEFYAPCRDLRLKTAHSMSVPPLLHSFCGPWILSLSSRLRQESIFLDSKNQASCLLRVPRSSAIYLWPPCCSADDEHNPLPWILGSSCLAVVEALTSVINISYCRL